MSLCNALSIVKRSPLEFTPHVDKQDGKDIEALKNKDFPAFVIKFYRTNEGLGPTHVLL